MPWTGDPSIAELIQQNLVATLQGITVANGFELDVYEVTRVIRDIEDEILNEIPRSKTPLHQVARGEESYEPAGTGQLVRASLSVVDWLLVYHEDLERAIRDTKIAVWADRRRGTHPTSGARLALDTRLLSIETAEQIFHPYELVRIEWGIDYTHLEGAP
jgi:hypothetical protein